MKTSTLQKMILLMVVGTLLQCKSTETDRQIETNVIELDVSTPSPASITSSTGNQRRLSAKSRQPVSFKVVGGNPYKYKYVINHKLVNFYEHPENLPFDKALQAINRNAAGAETNEPTPEKVESEKLQQQLDDLDKKLKKLDEQRKVSGNKAGIDKQIAENTQEVERIETQLDSVARIMLPKTLVNLEDSDIPRVINKSVKDDKINPEDVRKLTIESARKLLATSGELLEKMVLYSETECNGETLNSDDFIRNRGEFNQKKAELLTWYASLQEDAIANGTNEDSRYKGLAGKLAKNMEDIGKEIAKYNNVKLDNYTLPIDANGKNFDAIEISLERFDYNSPVPIDKYSYNIWMKGGIKIDVSGGVFITSLVNGEYYATPATNPDGSPSSLSVIRQKEKGNFEFGFGSTVNLSYRSASWANPTLNAGFLFTANQQFQFITGLGVIVGKQERLIFSGGLAMGTVTRISESMKADGSTPYDLGTSGSIPMDNQFDFGYFFGLTYNLTKTKIQQADK